MIRQMERIEQENQRIMGLIREGATEVSPEDVLRFSGEDDRVGIRVDEIQAETFRAPSTINHRGLDSHGTIIEPDGVRLERYLTNPVVLLSHNRRALPIGKTLELEVHKGERIDTLDQYAVQEDPQVAGKAWRMIQGKYMRGKSVGFAPIRWEEIKADDADWPGEGEAMVEPPYYRITDWELREHSLVTVPSHAKTLMRMADAVLGVALTEGMMETPQEMLEELPELGRLAVALRTLEERPELSEPSTAEGDNVVRVLTVAADRQEEPAEPAADPENLRDAVALEEALGLLTEIRELLMAGN